MTSPLLFNDVTVTSLCVSSSARGGKPVQRKNLLNSTQAYTVVSSHLPHSPQCIVQGICLHCTQGFRGRKRLVRTHRLWQIYEQQRGTLNGSQYSKAEGHSTQYIQRYYKPKTSTREIYEVILCSSRMYYREHEQSRLYLNCTRHQKYTRKIHLHT